jgi:hypothetical protein
MSVPAGTALSASAGSIRLATTIFGMRAAPGPAEVASDAHAVTSHDRNSTKQLWHAENFWSSTAVSVGQGAQGGFQLGVDWAAFAQHPGQAKQGEKDARPGSWLVHGEGGQVGGLAGRTAEWSAQPG